MKKADVRIARRLARTSFRVENRRILGLEECMRRYMLLELRPPKCRDRQVRILKKAMLLSQRGLLVRTFGAKIREAVR